MEAKDEAEMVGALATEAQRIEEDAIHSAKSHLNAADTWNRRHYWLGVPATVVTALAGAAVIKDLTLAAQLCALAGAILTGLLTFLKPTDRAAKHKSSGDQYLSLRNDVRVFREVELKDVGGRKSAPTRLKALSQRRNELNQSSPDIPRVAFEQARRGIEAGEATYRVDSKAYGSQHHVGSDPPT